MIGLECITNYSSKTEVFHESQRYQKRNDYATQKRISQLEKCLEKNEEKDRKQVNLLVYFLHHFHQSGLLGSQIICGIDSLEVANDCRIYLASMTVRGKKVRIYIDLDCDCGSHRNKRDKSIFVVGYHLHTLTVIDSESKHSLPIVSLVASANHHDSSLFRKTGVIVTTPLPKRVNLSVDIAPKI